MPYRAHGSVTKENNLKKDTNKQETNKMGRLFIILVLMCFAINECNAQALNPCGMTIEQLETAANDWLGMETTKEGETFVYLHFDETLTGFRFENGTVVAYTLLWLDEEEDKWYNDKIKCNE